jgi:hypothetical protein
MRSLGSPDDDDDDEDDADDDEDDDESDEDDEDDDIVDVPPGVVLPPLSEDLTLHAPTSARTRTHEDLRMARMTLCQSHLTEQPLRQLHHELLTEEEPLTMRFGVR